MPCNDRSDSDCLDSLQTGERYGREAGNPVLQRRHAVSGLSRARGHRGPRGDRRARALRQDRASSPTTRASCRRRAAARRSPTSTATRASCMYRGYPIEQLAETLHLPRSRLPDPERRAPEQAAARRVRRHRDAPHDGARAALALLLGLPPRRAPDGGAVRRDRRAVGVLSRLDRHQRSAQPRDLGVPADREAADDHGDDLQVQRRPAVHVSEEHALVRRELPLHDVRHAVRGVEAEPRADARDGAHPDPARRPRAERVDLDGAARGLDRREPVRLHRGGCREPVGPGARRRERGGAEDARRRSATRRTSRRSSSA